MELEESFYKRRVDLKKYAKLLTEARKIIMDSLVSVNNLQIQADILAVAEVFMVPSFDAELRQTPAL